MNLDAILDDLEAQLRAESLEEGGVPLRLDETTRVVVRQAAELSFSLVAPILGQDFVSGFDEATASWLIIHTPQTVDLVFEKAPDPDLPKLRRRSIRLADFLLQLELPAAIQFQTTDRQVHSATLIHVEGELLFIDRARAIGMRTPLNLRLLELTDKNELQEWRAR